MPRRVKQNMPPKVRLGEITHKAKQYGTGVGTPRFQHVRAWNMENVCRHATC